MTEHRAVALSDLADGKPHDVELGGTKVLLVKLIDSKGGETVHAVAALCPHKGVPLSKGVVHEGRIVCGIHRAAFDLATGAVVKPPACKSLARYDVRLEGEDIFVTVPENHEPHPVPDMAKRADDERHFVVVGAGGAGWRAAETLRREGFAGRLTVVTDEHPLPYDRTDLSKAYIKADEMPDDPVIRARAVIEEHDIEIVEGSATALDADAKSLTVGGETLTWDRLLIATGCDARRLDVPGGDLEGIHTIRTLDDAKSLRGDLTDALAQARDGGRTLDVAIVGGGFVGLEAASALCARDGVRVTVILQDEKPFANLFGEDFADRLKGEHEAAGVEFVTSAKVTGFEGGFEGSGRVEGVRIEGGDPVSCDLVVEAVGAVPRTGWLPFETLEDGGLAVTKTFALEGHPDIFAAGDIARVPTPWGEARIEHWRFAQECGEIAARNMLGASDAYDGTPFFWSMQQIQGSYTYTGHAGPDAKVKGNATADDLALRYIENGKVAAVLAHGIADEVTALEPKMAGVGPLPPQAA